MRAVALLVQVAERGIRGKVIGAQECGAGESCPVADLGLHELMEAAAAHPLGDEREHHVPAVAVGESLAGRELLREAVEGGQERLGLGEQVQRQGEDVVVDLPVAVLVEVVADTGGVGEQVLDRDGVVDQGQVIAEDGAHEVLQGRAGRARRVA